MKTYRLYIFDVDDNIAKRYSDELMPGVEDWFAFARQVAGGVRFAFATNQGGVGLRYWMEQGGFGDPSKYPTENSVNARLVIVRDRLFGGATVLPPIYVCFRYQSAKGNWSPTPHDITPAEAAAFASNDKEPQAMLEVTEDDLPGEWRKSWRKPAPGMLLQAMADAGVMPSATLFVGNGEEDRQAAAAAGCDFILGKDLFGGEE